MSLLRGPWASAGPKWCSGSPWLFGGIVSGSIRGGTRLGHAPHHFHLPFRLIVHEWVAAELILPDPL